MQLYAENEAEALGGRLNWNSLKRRRVRDMNEVD